MRAAMAVESGGGYLDDPAGTKKLIEAVVEGAIQTGIYVIIDWHGDHLNPEKAKFFFAEMAAKYGKYPNIIYEVFNEPAEETWPEVKAYAEAVIKVNRPD